MKYFNKLFSSIISSVVVLTLFFTTVASFCPAAINNSIVLIRMTVSVPARSVAFFDQCILELVSPVSEGEPQNTSVPVKGKQSSKRLTEIFILAIGALVFKNYQKILWGIFTALRNAFSSLKNRGEKISLFRKALFRWCRFHMLEFLTPVMRCVSSWLKGKDSAGTVGNLKYYIKEYIPVFC